MYDFIKKIITPKKSAPVIIAFSSIPDWVAGREKNSHSVLDDAAKAPIQKIRNSAAQLQHIVNSISGSEHDPALHPKLRAVAKNSLPLYVKAMNAALAKPLSDDIEDFYTDAVECLKSSLKSNSGPGRYLQVVFPEELKAVKMVIDGMGKELNILTAALATYQKQKTEIVAVSVLYQSVMDMQEDMKRSSEKELRITARIHEITSRISAIEGEEAEIAADIQGNNKVNECRAAVADAVNKRNEVTRKYAARSMTASHVFKKAEKIAAKQHQTSDVSSLKHTIEILSHHVLPDSLALSTALAAACPVAQKMIAAGDIPLKNREEREAFSDTNVFCTTMSELCAELSACDKACMDAETTLSIHPIVVRWSSLVREKTQLNSMLNKEQQLHSELVQWTAKTNEKIPAVTEELREKIEGIIGGGVQFQTETNAPV
ncbi:MAG: hypothetical protein Q8S57_02295 [Methanoregula sp.]|nr:hypothetical protein [Methanoregula sp.]